VPHELHVLALDNARLFYDLLFTASAQTLLEIAADPQHLGAKIGVISILHTCLSRAYGPRNLMKIVFS
jgi:hypothetical protein